METLKTIPAEVAALIPADQLEITKANLNEFSEAITRLGSLLEKCPKIGETDGMEEHPAIFHYFFGDCDTYVCEYDPKDGLMFGYSILNGDLHNSEWGYISVAEYANSKYLNIDYHFPEQSIEAALHEAYPKHFKKPQSLAALNQPPPNTQEIIRQEDFWIKFVPFLEGKEYNFSFDCDSESILLGKKNEFSVVTLCADDASKFREHLELLMIQENDSLRERIEKAIEIHYNSNSKPCPIPQLDE